MLAEGMDIEVLNEEPDAGWDISADAGWDISDTVCCICDDGGDVIYCDGDCFRSFHLSKGDSECSSLGLSKAEADRIDKFLCPNCKLSIHQCFVCKQLGCSAAPVPEVFKCNAAMCGHYYHPSCVVKLILNVKDTCDEEYIAMVESIKQGNWFDCPRHKCRKCGAGEDRENVDMQFGVCRRCPRAWHRQCLPRSVLYPQAGEPQRAWENLLPNRILIFCERHPIIPKLGTPVRNHVKFPQALMIKRKVNGEEQKLSLLKRRNETCLMGRAGEKPGKLIKHSKTERKVKPLTPTCVQAKPDEHGSTRSKLDIRRSNPILRVSKKKNVGSSGRQACFVKEDVQKVRNSQKFSMLSTRAASGINASLGRTSSVSKPQESGSRGPLQLPSKALEGKTVKLDIETKSMVKGIIERAKSSITVRSVHEKHVVPDCYKPKAVNLGKSCTLIKVESIVKGMQKALETLTNGGSIEDAKIKCLPEFMDFIERCKKDLGCYLCPFLHGHRYVSFGRHFTQSDKLVEIVERLHWYVDDGDIVLDFACGSNDFSLFMKQKLEQTGKKTCEYKNFDIIQAKHDFNFFKGDWFDVRPDTFPNGDKLIIGLNPPFHLANQFINHALKFKPKLIILICPRETERLDQKRDMYDLIWEDNCVLEGKSYYLPGSRDVQNNTLADWNKKTSPLYLWSKPNSTLKHRHIALERGHISLNTSSRYIGIPFSTTTLQLPLPSDSEMDDDDHDDDASDAAAMEHGVGKAMDSDQKEFCMSLAEPVSMQEPEGGHGIGMKEEAIEAKEQNKENMEHLNRDKAGVEPNIVKEPSAVEHDTAPLQDKAGSLKPMKQSTIEHPYNDGYAEQNQLEIPQSIAVLGTTKGPESFAAADIATSGVKAEGNSLQGQIQCGQQAPTVPAHVPLWMGTSRGSVDTVLVPTQSMSNGFNHAGVPRGLCGMPGMIHASARHGMPLVLGEPRGMCARQETNHATARHVMPPLSEVPRGTYGMQEMNYASARQGMPAQQVGLLRASAGGGATSFRPAHGSSGGGSRPGGLVAGPLSVRHVCPPGVYGSFQMQQWPPLGVHNPLQQNIHGGVRSWQPSPQMNIPHYPPMQVNQHAAGDGGWFDE